MSEINLLIALSTVDRSDESGKQIVAALEEQCPDLKNVYFAYTKLGVLQSCKEHTEINAVLLNEFLEESSPYTPEDIDKVDEIRDSLRVIPILSNERKGSEYVRKLHAYAVYGAVFEENAAMKYVASILNGGRSKRGARLYYGILEENETEFESTINPDKVKSCLAHIMNGGGIDKLTERAEFVHARLDVAEFRKVIESLPEDYVSVLRKSGKFPDYFVEDATPEPVVEEVKKTVIKTQEIKIPIPKPSFIQAENHENVQYVTATRKNIGVIGLSEKCGSTFVAVNLAAALAKNELYNPSLIQYPGTADDLYHALDFSQVFGDKFIRHFETLAESNEVPAEVNAYGGVRYYVKEGSVQDGTMISCSYVKAVKLLLKVDSPCIIDFGSYYDKQYFPHVLEECNYVIAVVDSRKDADIEKIRFLKEEAEHRGIKLIFVSNYGGTYESSVLDAIGEYCEKISLPYYNEAESKKCKNGLLVYDLMDDKTMLHELVELCDFIPSTKTNKRNVRHLFANEKKASRPVQEKPTYTGTMEIGFIGTMRGAGTTQSAIMCAYSLANDYSVAYVELNEHRHIGNLVELVGGGKDPSRPQFSYNGVDFYQRIGYTEFITKHREDYNFVIIDFGEAEEGMEDFLRMNKKFIVSSSAKWNLRMLDSFYENMQVKDPNNSFIYLFPLVGENELDELSDICTYNVSEGLAMNKDAFHPAPEIVKQFRNYLGIDMPAKKKGFLFWKR